jgi:hypothetical protein
VPLKDAGALVDDKPSPAEALEDAELRKIAVAAVRKALGKVDPRVRPILLGEDKARRVAKKLCMPVAEVYKLTGEGRKVVRSDKALAAAHRRIA